ncbi:hypothetical protein DENIS_1609 [Desulfonema ishimotonii]|uniref:DNA repair protein n=1 Tax=Desulfonema ishimotonii TaxID=45657 RepID=A0A401FUK2_9BACT|nr:CRISPR-associated endonuclease Cas6 [Desulfonema ishimotonii]GBC60652.1 hypothetical protein DENIS_1609 [Desulfonema ishimotonii]
MYKDTLSIKQCVIEVTFDRPLHRAVKSYHLRGAIANLYSDNILFHQHEQSGRVVYEYPQIQYKVINGCALVVGLGKGAEALAQVNMLERELLLGRERYQVASQQVSYSTVSAGISIPHLLYEFVTPWLALNEKNHDRYHRTGDEFRRKRILAKILTGNLLSMSKGLGYTVRAPIETEFLEFREIRTRLKGTPMTAFEGVFAVNFSIPAFWGIGKSASRGFGTIIQYFQADKK